MDISISAFNERFMEKVGEVEGQMQLQAGGRQYIKTELQETAFSRAIIPQEPITTAQCQRNLNDNSLYVIRDIEPDAAAVAVDNLGEPNGRYIKGERYIIPIVNFKTERFQITVEDLRAYQYKITKRIEDKSVTVIDKLEDKLFMKLCGAAITASRKGIKGSTGVNFIFNKTDWITLKNTMKSGVAGVAAAADARPKEVHAILMTTNDWEQVISLGAVSDDFGKDMFMNGYNEDILWGTKVVRTIKTDVLPVGHIWAYTKPDFLGHNFGLGDPTFEIRSNFGLIEWQSGESIGCNIGNIYSMAVLTLQGSTGAIAVSGTIPAAFTNYYKALL